MFLFFGVLDSDIRGFLVRSFRVLGMVLLNIKICSFSVEACKIEVLQATILQTDESSKKASSECLRFCLS